MWCNKFWLELCPCQAVLRSIVDFAELFPSKPTDGFNNRFGRVSNDVNIVVVIIQDADARPFQLTDGFNVGDVEPAPVIELDEIRLFVLMRPADEVTTENLRRFSLDVDQVFHVEGYSSIPQIFFEFLGSIAVNVDIKSKNV